MRHLLFVLPIAALGGCATPAPQSAAVTTMAAPFDVPMDPGLIRCQQLNNPVALSAATDWAMGQARAAALAGRINGVPDSTTVSNNLASFCSANGGSTVRTAAAQLGF